MFETFFTEINYAKNLSSAEFRFSCYYTQLDISGDTWHNQGGKNLVYTYPNEP